MQKDLRKNSQDCKVPSLKTSQELQRSRYIPPRAPEARATVVASPAGVLNFITYSFADLDSSEDPSTPDHAPSAPATSLTTTISHEATVARWRSRVVLRSSSPSSLTHSLPSTVIASLAPCWIVPAPPGVPRRPAILVLPVPARISANRRRFHSSSSSSSPCKRRKTSSCLSSSEGSSPDSSTSLSERSSHSVTTHSPSSSTRPSRKRCRSPTTLVTLATPTPGALLQCHIVDIGVYIDLDVMADIDADNAVEAAQIGVDRVCKPELPAVVLGIANIEEEQRAWEIRALADEREMAHMRERISVLGGDELRQIRSSRYYDMIDFRRLETFAMRHIGYRP
ncbi:hypothetical protein Tco_1317671 [Tanacetum coccineum]